MSLNPAYPPVRRTPENAPMLDAWQQRGEILLQRCDSCGAHLFYPRAVCPSCWAETTGWVPACGTGRIVSFSVVHKGLPDVFMAEAPILLAEIELAEGVLMIARVLCADPGRVTSGMAVAALPLAEARAFPLPTFRLEGAG
ncbi:Zn-ribbon domain-containing OB-fold protein [Salipiger abyssi]|uniref:Zn-ribbon domain-containing OB-fold protein n=1 Tax=Salipiger abyssi TaxID=1250539 RepID=UPI001A8F10CB|nr:OB-fold domain-containing protein [Salipiger abyssi]MBN9885861.1 OB-fold domain-containing protein [Salipiger abyssi]